MLSSLWKNRQLAIVSAIIGVSLLISLLVFIASCQSKTASTGTAHPGASPVATSKAGFPAFYFSPYVDIEPANTGDPFAMVDQARQTANGGARYFTLAFITARAGCLATWSGQTTINQQNSFLLPEILALRAKGGDVTVSFGGPQAGQDAEQQDLAQACQTVQSLRQQYQNVIDAYQLTHIDFMLEGTLLNDQSSLTLRNQAIAGLHSGVAGQPLSISYSLPVTAQGLSQADYSCLENALEAHVALAHVNLVVEDFTLAQTAPTIDTLLEHAVENVSQQLLKMEQDDNISTSASLAVTPLIGESANSKESFTLGNGQNLLAFASAHTSEISELSMWSLQRDHPCAGSTVSLAQGLCSGLQQKDYDFTRIFSAFSPGTSPTSTPATATPAPTLTPTPTSPPTPTGGASVAQPTPTPTATPRTGNQIMNPTFNGLTDWNCEAPDVAQNNTLRILPTATSNGGCTQTIANLQPNHTYTLQAYVKGSYTYMQVAGLVRSVFSTDYTLLQLSFNTGSSTSVTVAFYAGIAQPEVDVQNVSLQ
jgi:hypothetical protein